MALGCAPSYRSGPDAELEIGTGENRFLPVEDGASVEIICGPQGGYHIWVSVRARYLDLTSTHTSVNMRLDDDGPFICERSMSDLALIEVDGWGEFAGIACFVVNPVAVVGSSVLLSAEVDDRDGGRCEATARWLPVGPKPCPR